MAETIRGKLVWQGSGANRARRVVYPTRKGQSQPTFFNDDQIDPALLDLTEAEVDVDLELQGGRPVHIRGVGQPWPPHQVSRARPQTQEGGQPHRRQGPQGPQGVQRASPQGGQRSQEVARNPAGQQGRPTRGDFHNPYNFVPALPREHIGGELGDHGPVGHERYQPGYISGVIRVKLTTETPLLLPDAAAQTQDNNNHKTFPVRLGSDGRPYLAPTSIKGMLRAAFEAVTNSRLAVFAGHEERLADRMPARDGLALVPARIVVINGVKSIELLPGDSQISNTGRPDNNGPMYAGWLPRYDRRTGQVSQFAVRFPNMSLPGHGDAVEVWLELWQKTGQFPFNYWSVRKCVPVGQILGAQPPAGTARGPHRPVAGQRMITVHGYVCVTNRNIDRKHDERVFFTNRSGPLYQPLTEVLCQQWKELITNYQTIHETERAAGRNCPPALNNSEWSRQVVGGPAERQLSAGTLCYAACRNATVTALYPVMISRRLFEAAPLLLLPPELRPATLLSQLSPADRVFGWVKQNGKGAYRGNLRVGPVTCVTLDAIINFPRPGLPLAILGQPKQQQARFYAARTNQGEAQVNRLSKEQAGYQTGKGLRGRKVYPHHVGLTDEYWNQPTEDRTQHRVAGHFQEYRRPHKPELEEYQDERGRSNTRLLLNSDGTYALMTGEANEQRDDQNRSVLGWVRQKAEFFFDLQVTNLSPVELGALLWLLSPEISFHRLGGGKPFGFGSVRLNIQDAETFLYNGRDWSRFYESLDAITLPQVDRQATITAFKQAIVAAYGSQGSTFEMVPFIRAFRRAAEGFTTGLPIHYPRARQPGQTSPVPPHPDGLAYEWFVTNDRTEHNQVIEGHALPDLVDQNGNPDPGLPVLDAPRRGG